VTVASDVSRYVVLLPALLVGLGLVGGVLILLGRAFADTVREARHPRWIVGGLIALVGAIVLLTFLGIELPRE
jgi:hypothetical protein